MRKYRNWNDSPVFFLVIQILKKNLIVIRKVKDIFSQKLKNFTGHGLIELSQNLGKGISPVSFVHDKVLEGAQVEPLGVFQVVHQPARRGNDDVRLFAEIDALRDHVHPT